MPLNPYLHGRLKKICGDVTIVNEREQFVSQSGAGPDDTKVVLPGETYVCRCPLCGHAQGLWISYLWGIPDGSGEDRWSMATCYGSNCLEQKEHRDALSTRVFKHLRRQRCDLEICKGRLNPYELHPVRWPGPVLPINSLPPKRPAIEYLRGRGFNSDYLYHRWHVHHFVGRPTSGHMNKAPGMDAVVMQLGEKAASQDRHFSISRRAPRYRTAATEIRTNLALKRPAGRFSPDHVHQGHGGRF